MNTFMAILRLGVRYQASGIRTRKAAIKDNVRAGDCPMTNFAELLTADGDHLQSSGLAGLDEVVRV